MPGRTKQSATGLVARVKSPDPIGIDCSVVAKGIDNYAIDIEIDAGFISLAGQVIEAMLKRVIAGQRAAADDVEALRDMYRDLVGASLHRTKTGATPEEVSILHLGLVKFLVEETHRQMAARVKQVEEALAQQQYAGSRNLLATQANFTWLRRNQAAFVFRTMRALFKQLQREETNQLRPLREQYLGGGLAELPNIMLNPMLATSNPLEPHLLLESYAVWPRGGQDFVESNAKLEALLSKRLRELAVVALKSAEKPEEVEIYDELGGIFGVQPLLGASADQKDQVRETFCWLDHPGNMRLLFDRAVHERISATIEGRRARWSFRSESKQLVKLGAEAGTVFAGEAHLREVVAGYLMRDHWQPAWDEFLDVPLACAYVAGNDAKRILARIDQSKDGATAFVKRLDEWAKELGRRIKAEREEFVLRMLTDLGRYRLHLKYFRFAHRMFNRINVITDPQKIQLSRAGGHLHRLLGTKQGKDQAAVEPEIVHHAILKADVRGSTVVTQELIRQNLNPASYFSTRFFGPINDLLGVYGAVKVFIEGDAVILGIYEHNVDPGQWYSVSRACGIAREMLDIVTSKNANARQAGIPRLEIGIGICYSDERPMFLFDEDKPIMISPAIGDADRMSSCSWKLREAFQRGHFNVEVLEIDEDDQQRGEKGQHHLRYNVNGILLADTAFEKLKSEIRLKKLKVNVGETAETVFVGRFPDVFGKERDLVIREGVVGTWRNETVHRGTESGEVFYEVLPNSRFASKVLELARSQANRAE